MQILKQKNGIRLFVKADGRIDANTAIDFGTEINDNLDDINELVIDFQNVDYISSIGLRVLLELQKRMDEQGYMIVENVQPAVMEVFKMTGFTNILTIG